MWCERSTAQRNEAQHSAAQRSEALTRACTACCRTCCCSIPSGTPGTSCTCRGCRQAQQQRRVSAQHTGRGRMQRRCGRNGRLARHASADRRGRGRAGGRGRALGSPHCHRGALVAPRAGGAGGQPRRGRVRARFARVAHAAAGGGGVASLALCAQGCLGFGVGARRARLARLGPLCVAAQGMDGAWRRRAQREGRIGCKAGATGAANACAGRPRRAQAPAGQGCCTAARGLGPAAALCRCAREGWAAVTQPRGWRRVRVAHLCWSTLQGCRARTSQRRPRC